MSDTLHDLPPGAHLTTPRRGYVHHGIYAGDGRVVHYAGFSRILRRGPVEKFRSPCWRAVAACG